MKTKPLKLLIAVLITFLLYGVVIYNRIHYWEFSLDYVYFKFLPYCLTSIVLVLAVSKLVLKRNFQFYNSQKSSYLNDIVMSFLILAIYYEVVILHYGLFEFVFRVQTDFSEVHAMFRDMMSSKVSSIVYFGPYILFTQGLLFVVSIFFLQNIWNTIQETKWHWFILFLFALFSSFLNIYYGLSGVVLAFFIHSIAFVAYYKYRRVLPIFIYYVLTEYLDIFGAISYLSSH